MMDPKRSFILKKEDFRDALTHKQLSIEAYLQQLVPIVKPYALAPISNYTVAAVGLSDQGHIYCGVNLEFPGHQLNQTVHAEQFLACLVGSKKEKLVKMALSAAPCGHCRQFLMEIADERLEIITPHVTVQLGSLLNFSFGPQDLCIKDQGCRRLKETIPDSPLLAKALESASNAYVPYTGACAAVAIQTTDGTIFSAATEENAAFNPSLPPFQSAFILAYAHGYTQKQIQKVLLVEYRNAQVKHAATTELLVKSIAPNAQFDVKWLDEFFE